MNQPVLSSPISHRRRNRTEVAALLSAFAQSGQSVREFCRRQQMQVSSFSSLLRRHAGQHSSVTASSESAHCAPSATAFLPVKIVDDSELKSAPRPSSLIVEIPGGCRIAVERDFDTNTLRRLVAALSSE